MVNMFYSVSRYYIYIVIKLLRRNSHITLFLHFILDMRYIYISLYCSLYHTIMHNVEHVLGKSEYIHFKFAI